MRAALLVALSVLLAGCTLPWEEDAPEDPAARAPPGPVSFTFDHDFLGNGRNVPFRIETSTGTITIRIDVTQMPDAPACKPDRTPPRVTIFKPGEEPFFTLTAPIGEGAPGSRATEDGSGDCSVSIERTVDRIRGVWRVEFLGSGNFTGRAVVVGAGAADAAAPDATA